MKRRDLEKQLTALAKQAQVPTGMSQGANHAIFHVNGRKIPIPRHTEINEHLAKKILDSARSAIDEA